MVVPLHAAPCAPADQDAVRAVVGRGLGVLGHLLERSIRIARVLAAGTARGEPRAVRDEQRADRRGVRNQRQHALLPVERQLVDQEPRLARGAHRPVRIVQVRHVFDGVVDGEGVVLGLVERAADGARDALRGNAGSALRIRDGQRFRLLVHGVRVALLHHRHDRRDLVGDHALRAVVDCEIREVLVDVQLTRSS